MCLTFSKTKAQELLIGLGENALIERQKQELRHLKSNGAPLALPFIDDFAKPTNYFPDKNNWIDNYVFINNSYAINPPTIGVATFDAFDNKGKLYPNAGSFVFAADTLTSQKIDLNYVPSDSIYLSFFFQPQGYGDMPELGDSLTLQFLTLVNDNGKAIQEWVSVWRAAVNIKDSTLRVTWNGVSTSVKKNDLGTAFYRAHLKIDKTKFLHTSFQFRFINYASISVNRNAPGRSTSTDHWHLDFVYLDKNRTITDLNLPDVALASPQKPFSNVYEQIPGRHLGAQEAIHDLFPDPMLLSLTYSNLGWGTKSVNRNFKIQPLYGIGSTVQYDGGAENIFNGQTIEFDYQALKYKFSTVEDSAAFLIKSYIVTDSDPLPLRKALRYNDTTSYTQYFHDCYAYDDGTAENGYGLFGNYTANGKVGVLFQSYESDTLRGVYMYFNRTINSANAVPFFLTVWSDLNGEPDTVMYKGKVSKPVFKDSLNKYVAYKFDKPLFIKKGTKYYIGWTQMSDSFLDIGFDRNRNHKEKNFYNIYNKWEQSAYEGSLMLRPIFTRKDSDFPEDHQNIQPIETNFDKSTSFYLYPNPVKGSYLNIAKRNALHSPIDVQHIEVYNVFGELILGINPEENTSLIDISSLPVGTYFIRVWEKDKMKGVERFMVIE